MKVILILLLFSRGEAMGQFTPAPAFETMGECSAFFDANKALLETDETDVVAYCVSETEVKRL